jgi:hypothetical protein
MVVASEDDVDMRLLFTAVMLAAELAEFALMESVSA